MSGSSNKENVSTDSHERFDFADYVSPHPKRIPFESRLNRADLVEYETKKIVDESSSRVLKKTKHESLTAGASTALAPTTTKEVDPIAKEQAASTASVAAEGGGDKDKDKDNNVLDRLKEQDRVIHELREQVRFLQLKFENSSAQNKHVAFEETVVEIAASSKQQTAQTPCKNQLNDKVSRTRSHRSSTPYKASKSGPSASRADYRVTPMPSHRHQPVLQHRFGKRTTAQHKQKQPAFATPLTSKHLTPIAGSKGTSESDCPFEFSWNK